MNDKPLVDRYGGFFRSREKLNLSEAKVPPRLRPFLMWAAYWGVSDDIDREMLREEAPAEAIEELRALISTIDVDLNDWLAGPAADQSSPSAEYVAFSAMRMASF